MAPPPAFGSLAQSTSEDWIEIKAAWTPWLDGVAERVMAHMKLLADDHGGFPVSRLEHGLQTTTRARRAGHDDEYVVCALLHDIGDTLSPANHADFAAALLKPYVSEANHWMVAHHGIFQLYHHGRHWGLDPNARDQFREHPHFARTVKFCELDQASFDAGYVSFELDTFASAVANVLSVKSMMERASA